MSSSRKLLVFALFSFAVFTSLGWYIHQGVSSGGGDLSSVYKNISKFSNVVSIADKYYLDDIKWNKVFESALRGMLKELDPHSIYITPKVTKKTDEEFSGKYYGIGIEYDVIDNYITVLKVLSGSPSEKSGLMSNDRIVKINGKDAYAIKHADVPKRLKGEKGTIVTVTVERDGSENFDVEIERDEIPTFSVSSYFMLDEKTGYLHLEKFIAKSAQEVEEALQELESKGMKRLIFDMRGNLGGLLDQAVQISSKFLPGHKKVVFTKGKIKEFDEVFYTDHYDRIRDARKYPVILMIDRNSASAAEIVSGALQDHDRAYIVGERSFGKGLVQRPFHLSDGSSFRLTIARYYTPSGRLIQRDYKGKTIEQYYREVETDTLRYTRKHRDKEKLFKTLQLKRNVYGGGGITPDSLLKLNYSKIKHPQLFNQLLSKKVLYKYTKLYKKELDALKKNKKVFMEKETFSDKALSRLQNIMDNMELKYKVKHLKEDKAPILRRLKAITANLLWDQYAYFEVYRRADKNINKAKKLFKEANKMQLQ